MRIETRTAGVRVALRLKRRWIVRRKYLLAFVVVAASLVAVLRFSGVLDVNRYRGSFQSLLSGRLDREVSLGRLQLSLLPVGVRAEKVVVADDRRFHSSRPFLEAEELYVRLRWLPLLRGRFEARSLELRRPRVELVRHRDGAWNVASLRRTDRATPPGAFVVDRLVVSDGSVAITDLRHVPSVAGETAPVTEGPTYRHVDIEAHDISSERPFDLVMTMTVGQDGEQRLGLRGRVGPVDSARPAATPFEGTAELNRVGLSTLRRALQLATVAETDAVVSGTASVQVRDRRWVSNGALRLDGTRVHRLTLGYAIGVDFDVAHDTGTGVMTVRSATIRLDQTPLVVTGTVNLRADAPVLETHVIASEVSLAEAARLASAFGLAFGTRTQVQGRLTADVIARGPVDRPTLEGRVRLGDVTISGEDVPQPVRTPALDLTLTKDAIQSDDFAATTNGTTVGVRFTLREYATPAPVIDMVVRAADASVADVLHVARAWGVRGAAAATGTGRITLNVRARGGLSDPAIDGTGTLANAALKTPTMARPLLVRHAALTFSSRGVTAERVDLSVGGTRATGRITIRQFVPPRVEFEAVADTIDVDEMQQLFEPGRGQATTSRPLKGDGLLLHTTGSGRLRVGSLRHGQLVLEDVRTTTRIDCGVIRLEPLTAALFGGRHRGAITLDARRTPSTVVVSSALEQVDANQLATAVAGMRDVVHGALASVVRVTFSPDGPAVMAGSLNGTLSLRVPNGRIANMDLMHEVTAIARFVTGRRATVKATPVVGLSGTFTVIDGKAQTDDLVASIEGGRLAASGVIDLVTHAVNLRVTAVLSREFSQRPSGSGVGGLMSTVLANQRGELVVPVLLTGTLHAPRFAPDAQRFAEMKMRNLTPTVNDPRGLVSGILGAIGEAQEDGAPRSKTLEDALLRLLRGGRPTPKEPPGR